MVETVKVKKYKVAWGITGAGDKIAQILEVMKDLKKQSEDVVEIQGHGGLVPPRAVLRVVLTAGARLAEPGEFSRRAFLNGRLDLTQAEAIMDLVHARSERATQAARSHD